MRQAFLIAIFLILGWGYLGGLEAHAISISLESIENPQTVKVGDAVTFQVKLSGLENNQELDLLGVTIEYNGWLFGLPTISKGEIVPDPFADTKNFFTAPDKGLADASFKSSTSNTNRIYHIRSDGVFFSFQAEATHVGDGQVSVDVAYAMQFNSSHPENSTELDVGTGPALDVSVTPEPSVFVLLITAALAAAAYGLKQRLL
jgi:hypothetical protein